MKVWIGHYEKCPKDWFVVWANSKTEASLQIDCTVGEPDLDSFMELNEPGFVDFTLTAKEDETGECFECSPPEESVKDGYWLVFGEVDGEDERIIQHFKRCMKKADR